MDKNLQQRFGYRVKKMRQAADYTQYAFADRCGFARTYMSRIERGTANPSLLAIEVLATALGVSIDQLFKDL